MSFPAEAGQTGASVPGQKRTKSPPGPNLQTGSISGRLAGLVCPGSVGSKILSFAFIGSFFYRQSAAKNPNKNRTKIDEIVFFLPLGCFCPAAVIIWDDDERVQARASASAGSLGLAEFVVTVIPLRVVNVRE